MAATSSSTDSRGLGLDAPPTPAPGPAPAPPVRVGPSTDGGAPTPSTVHVSPAPEPAQITPTWEKPWIIPRHNNAFPPSSPPYDGTIPADAKTKMNVATTAIPDGTAATISVRHCETNAAVLDINGLVVRGNRVVDATSGQPSEFTFPAGGANPWSLWDKPYFYFRVTINGRAVDGEKDYRAHADQCLMLRYYVQCIAESTTLAGVLPEANNVLSIVNGVAGGQALVQDLSTPVQNVLWYTSLLRGTYAVHLASHGNCVDRSSGRSICTAISNPPPVDVDNPSAWKGTTHVAGSRANPTPWIDYADADVTNATTTPSVPAILFYGSCCLTGFEPSFADALIARGCRNVILFRVSIPDSEAPQLARDFWTAWAGFNLDPAKIPDCFFRYAGDHYDHMRPVLYGPGGGRAQGHGLSSGAIAGIVIGAIVGAALIGVGVWALATHHF